MDTETLHQELTCPITHDLLVDPVVLPCCGKSVGKEALRSSFEESSVCPLCRSTSPNFHGSDFADSLPRNRIAQALLETLSTPTEGAPVAGTPMAGSVDSTVQGDVLVPNDADENLPKLSASFCVLPTPSHSMISALACGAEHGLSLSEDIGRIARLQFRITNASRVGLRRVLCVLVVDQSYSMTGNPWKQVALAMKHIVAMSREPHVRHHVTLKVVRYNSRAFVLDCLSGTIDDVNDRIDSITPGYGTSFRSAFSKAAEVMRSEVIHAESALSNGRVQEGSCSPMPHQVSVVFMTDGQASETREGLAEEFRSLISKFQCECEDGFTKIRPEVTVHAVGFSGNCDKNLLDQIREAGTVPGQFRYCEPGDSEDALCGRITGIFEQIVNHGGCELTIDRLLLPSIINGTEPTGQSRTESQAPSNTSNVAVVPPQPEEPSWEFLGQDGEVLPPERRGRISVQLRTKPNGVGTAVAWVKIKSFHSAASGDLPSFVLPCALTFNKKGQTSDNPGDADWTVVATEDHSFSSVDAIKRAWVGVRIHAIAEDAIECLQVATSKETTFPNEAVRLWGAFLENRLKAVSSISSDAHGRVPALLGQLGGLSNWGLACNDGSKVDMGRLRDLSSASAFSSSRLPSASTNLPTAASISASLRSTPVFVSRDRYNTKANCTSLVEAPIQAPTGRTLLQKSVVNWGQRRNADQMVKILLGEIADPGARAQEIDQTDNFGNTVVHLAAYHGQDDALPILLQAAKTYHVDAPNSHGETPITIAIKQRGFNRTVEVLQAWGGSIPEDRVSDLIKYCERQGFTRMSAILGQKERDGMLGPYVKGSTPSLSIDYGSLPPLKLMDDTSHVAAVARLSAAVTQGRPIEWASVLRMSLKYQDEGMLKQSLSSVEAEQCDPLWVFADCFPRKPDAPEIPVFLSLLTLILEFSPDLAEATMAESGDSLLHRAVNSGSLPHCQFLVNKGVAVDALNLAGDSPLAVACQKKFPCIVDFLAVEAGADVDLRNASGMTPIAIAVKVGSLRIVEALLSAGAASEVVNDQQETLLHIAVRSNRKDILAALLDRVDPETMMHADKKGFNPLWAAVEQGSRVECLSLLMDAADGYARLGIPAFVADAASAGESSASPKLPCLGWKLAATSPDLPGATLLHAAAFFGCSAAVLTSLLNRGANPNAVDSHGMTPLHAASQRGDASAVYTLMAGGADPLAPDRAGRTAISYGRSHPEVVAALLGPLVAPLRSFASGSMPSEAIHACAGVVSKAASVAAEPGIFSASEVLDTPLFDGATQSTALNIAVSHGNFDAVQSLVAAGASPRSKDSHGLNAAEWAQMLKSQKILCALGVSPRPLLPAAQNHAEVGKRWGRADALTVFLGSRRAPSWPSPTQTSTIHTRLGFLARAFKHAHYSRSCGDGSTSRDGHAGNQPLSVSQIQSASRAGAIDRVTFGLAGSAEQLALESDRWVTKIDTAALVASAGGESLGMRPLHVFASYLATRNGSLVPALNQFLSRVPVDGSAALSLEEKSLLGFSAALSDALGAATNCGQEREEEEQFKGGMGAIYAPVPPDVPRSALAVGSVIQLGVFASGTTDRSVAVAALANEMESGPSPNCGLRPSCFSGRGGVILAISSPRSARIPSVFPDDCEVMFRPGTEFIVTGWSRADPVGEEGVATALSPAEIEEAKNDRDSSLVVRLEVLPGQHGSC